MIVRNMVLLCLMAIMMNSYADNGGNQTLINLDRGKPSMQASQDVQDITKAQYRELQERHKYHIIVGMIAVTPIFLLILLFFTYKSKDLNEKAIIHSSGLVLVIQATTIIVIASPTSEQLTAAIGVLAAIAGYLFGTTQGAGK